MARAKTKKRELTLKISPVRLKKMMNKHFISCCLHLQMLRYNRGLKKGRKTLSLRTMEEYAKDICMPGYLLNLVACYSKKDHQRLHRAVLERLDVNSNEFLKAYTYINGVGGIEEW